MDKIDIVLNDQQAELAKALGHLEYSYQKVCKMPLSDALKDEEILETWESFCARFARVADLFLMKYLRLRILKEDAGFDGTLRDRLHFAEKMGIISDSDSWMAIRELRNIASHAYAESDLLIFFQRFREECPKLLAIKALLV